MRINQVVWSSLAIQSLNETNTFLLNFWTEDVSDRFLASIDEIIEILKKNPSLGSNIEKLIYRRVLLNKHISLFYKVEKGKITILLFWDNRQDPKMLKEKIKL